MNEEQLPHPTVYDPHGVFQEVTKGRANVTRDLPLPYDHLTVQGPTVAERNISRDIISTLSYLVGDSDIGPVDVQCTIDGALKVAVGGSLTIEKSSHTFISTNNTASLFSGPLNAPVKKLYGYHVSAAGQPVANLLGAWVHGLSNPGNTKTTGIITHEICTISDGTHFNYHLDETIFFSSPIDISKDLDQSQNIDIYIVPPGVTGFNFAIDVFYSA